MEPIAFDLDQAVNMGGLWLGPMLGPIAVALWTVVGPALDAIYQSLVLSSTLTGPAQDLGQALGAAVRVAMIATAVVLILVALFAILVLILGLSFLVTVLRLIIREPAPA